MHIFPSGPLAFIFSTTFFVRTSRPTFRQAKQVNGYLASNWTIHSVRIVMLPPFLYLLEISVPTQTRQPQALVGIHNLIELLRLTKNKKWLSAEVCSKAFDTPDRMVNSCNRKLLILNYEQPRKWTGINIRVQTCTLPFGPIKAKVKFTLEQATKTQKGNRGVPLLFL